MATHRILLLTLIVAAACTADAPTGPASMGGAHLDRSADSSGAGIFNPYRWSGDSLPGSRRTADAIDGKFVPANCVPKESSRGSAVIGPNGGVLEIGTHRLIVPAGALSERVLISGTVPEGKPFEIDLQPHGLQFRKAAGLILDATSCTNVPEIVYIIDEFNLGPPIPAYYSAWWKAIACPIWHFSGYMIALGDHSESNEIGAQ